MRTWVVNSFLLFPSVVYDYVDILLIYLHMLQYMCLFYFTQDYNPQTGNFTCPLDGIYVFHVTVTLNANSTTNNHIAVQILKDGVVVGSTYETGHVHSGSVTVFTQCNNQQRVWVRAFRGSTGITIGKNWSYFSGAFLRTAT